ncbi:MAG: DUF255 domain-containing protein [Actinobacteria bacterium]|nr:DUF255 domain-containing protein [Actinomycetota bacterium]
MEQSPQTPSRLSGEKSAYLQAHTDDLVQWRPWGKKAFARAKKMNLPIFLSVGYASCPQCRLTQAESFRDTELGGFLNRHFVRILVDRECRPDIDALFQTWSGAATGAGGWPLNLFLLEDGSPFLGGTYFPRVANDPDAQSFMDLASTGLRVWTLDREGAIAGGAEALEFLRAMNSPADSATEAPDLDSAIEKIRELLDEEHGGLGHGPKFPQTPVIDLLLATHGSSGAAWRIEAARKWLNSMLSSAIFDSADGGVFRMSDLRDWGSPAAEKALIDQGLLLSTLARANAIEPSEAYQSAARLTADMLERRMRRPDCGFFSAVFIDAEEAEGESVDYQVTQNTITAHNAIAARGLIEAGAEFGDDWMVAAGMQALEWLLGECLKGRKLLRTSDDKSLKDIRIDQGLLLSTLARANAIEPSEAYQSAARLTADMLERRMRRPDCGFFSAVFIDAEEAEGESVDYQVTQNTITAHNAIAARGLIEAGAEFGDDWMVAAGMQALEWLLGECLKGRKLLRTSDDKSLKDIRFLEDYAATVAACLSAYEHAGRKDMLRTAIRLQGEAAGLFASDQGFVMSVGDPLLPVAPVEYADSPAPSGASMLAENAVRLAKLTGDEAHLPTAASALRQFDRTLALAPHLAAHALYVASIMGR